MTTETILPIESYLASFSAHRLPSSPKTIESPRLAHVVVTASSASSKRVTGLSGQRPRLPARRGLGARAPGPSGCDLRARLTKGRPRGKGDPRWQAAATVGPRARLQSPSSTGQLAVLCRSHPPRASAPQPCRKPRPRMPIQRRSMPTQGAASDEHDHRAESDHRDDRLAAERRSLRRRLGSLLRGTGSADFPPNCM